MTKRDSLDQCPRCGDRRGHMVDENYSNGQYAILFECEHCGAEYYELYYYTHSWTED